MALTNAQIRRLKKQIRRDPDSWAVFKAFDINRATRKAALEAMDDWFIGGLTTRPTTSLKAALVPHLGALTNAQARKIALVWIRWKGRI